MTTATRFKPKQAEPFAAVFVDDSVAMSAPQLPKGRPPTKSEMWAYISHVYKGRKTVAEMKVHARQGWAFAYCWYVNFKGWDKHPDWIEGQPVIEEAVPKPPLAHDEYEEKIQQLWQVARERRAA